MRFILSLLITIFLAGQAAGAVTPYSIQSDQVDSAGTNVVTTYIPPTGAPFVLYFNTGTNQVTPLAFGTNLSITSNTLNAAGASARVYSALQTRSLNTAYQINALRDADVTYYVDVTISSLLTNVSGSIQVQYADDSGFTTNVVSASPAVKVAFGGVLSANIVNTATVHAIIPAAKYVKIITASTGSPTYGSPTGQEVLE